MNHPGEGMLQAFLDGQLAAAERSRIAEHAGTCPVCQAELEELRAAASLFSTAISRADAGLPDLASAHARILAQPRRPVLRLIPRERPSGRELRRALVRAAVLVLFVAGAASAAIPGGAVRRFFAAIWHQTTRLFGGAPEPARAPLAVTPGRGAAPAPAPAPPAGVSVLPQDGRVRILVTGSAHGLRVRVRVVESDRASVEAAGGAASAHFNTGPGRIEVSGGGAGDLRVALPRAAQHVTVEIAGKPVLSKDGAEMRVFAPAEHVGGETIFQSPALR